MLLDAITVFVSADGRPVNKVVRRAPDGSISKGMARHSGRFIARTVPMPDLEALAEVLRSVGERPDACISLSLFRDAPEGEFLVLPATELAAHLGVEPSNREALAGVHEIDGAPTAARIRQSMVPGTWLLFDRDAVTEMPQTLATLDFAGWRAAIDLLFPGFATAGCVVVPSASTRVTVDGMALASNACHVFVRVNDPLDIGRAWSQATHRALITEYRGKPLAFAKPKRDRQTGEVVAIDWWTIFDKSTAASARLVFDGAPVGHGASLEVLPLLVETHDGPALELGCTPDLRPRKEVAAITQALSEMRGARVLISLTRKGGIGRITGVEVVTADLTFETVLETPSGRRTVAELHKAGAGHTRCQSPFRESSTWAAYYNTHADGVPFVFDTGTNEKHVLRREGRTSISTIIREWLGEELEPEFKYPDGSLFAGRRGRRLGPRDVQPSDELIARLGMASDAPCDDQGRVKRQALPAQFRSWLPVAWGTLHRQLPEQDEIEIASPSAADELKQQLAGLLKTMVSLDWGNRSRHSLGAWARYHATLQPGQWCRVGSYDLWGRIEPGQTQRLQLALLPTLSVQARAAPEIAALSLNALTKRCRDYGLSVPGDNRLTATEGRFRAVILNEEFVQSLALPDAGDDALAAALHARMKSAGPDPEGGQGGKPH
jgi:hypothetical protein